MPDSLRSAYEHIKDQSKTPVWTFSGLALVVVLVAVAIISDRNKDAKNKDLVGSPRTGDVYEVKESTEEYTLYKVNGVTNDSVFILANQYTVTSPSGFNQLRSKGDAAYDSIAVRFAKSKLKDMLDKGEILDVDRK